MFGRVCDEDCVACGQGVCGRCGVVLGGGGGGVGCCGCLSREGLGRAEEDVEDYAATDNRKTQTELAGAIAMRPQR